MQISSSPWVSGVRPAWGIKIPTIGGVPDYDTILDGETFTLDDGVSKSVTFEGTSTTMLGRKRRASKRPCG